MEFTKGSSIKTLYWNPNNNHSRPKFLPERFNMAFALVSDSLFEKSTEVIGSDFSGTWSGVKSLPDISTYTLKAEEGQPYSYNSIHPVDSTEVIKTENNITFFRKSFDLTDTVDLNARIRMTVDDAMEIYINDILIAREDHSGPPNFKSPYHDLMYRSDTLNANGYNGNDAFDYVKADLKGIFKSDENTVILVVRNKSKSGDKGGFSFRLDLGKGESTVIKKMNKSVATTSSSSIAQGFIVYPNPTMGVTTIELLQESSTPSYVTVHEAFSGNVLSEKIILKEVSIDLSDYSNGLYILKINIGGKTYFHKIIKN
jgi:hypothetical protein